MIFFLTGVVHSGYAQCRPQFYTGLLDYGLFYSAGDSITRVTFNTINHYTGNSAPITDSLYSDYTYLSTQVCKGQSYTLTVWAGDTSVYHTGVIAWIDFNDNGQFEASEMVLRDSVKIQNRTQAASAGVQIPLTAVTGSVKMRVLAAYTIAPVFPNRMPPNDACYNYGAVCNDSFPSLIGIPYPDLDPACNLCISCDALAGEFEEYTIQILERPSATLSGSQTVCSGTGVTLSVSLTGSPAWTLGYSDGTTTTTVTGITASPYQFSVTPSFSRTYSLVSLTDNACFGGLSGPTILSVPPQPAVSLSGAGTICPGNTVQLSFSLQGRSPWNLAYSDGTTTTSVTGITQSPYVATLTPASSLTYTPVSLSDACGSGTTAGQFTVALSPALSATLSGGGNVCQGSTAQFSVVLSGVSPWNLTWSDGTASVPITGITASPYVQTTTPAGSVTYSLTSVGDACSGSGSVSGNAPYVLRPLPVASLSGNTSYFCSSSTTLLTASLTGSSPWSLSYSDGSTSFSHTGITNTPYSVAVSPVQNTTYILTAITDAHCTGNSYTGQQIFVLDNGPNAVLSGAQTVCPGSAASFQITGTNGIQPWDFSFSDGTVQTTYTGITALPYQFQITPASSRTYFVSGISHACSLAGISGTGPVTLATLPGASISGPGVFCIGTPVTLTIGLSGQSPWQIQYSDGTTNQSISGITQNPYALNLTPQVSTTYTLSRVTDAFCHQDLNLQQDLLARAPMQVNMNGGGAICEGSSLILSAIFSGTTPYDLVWSDGTTHTSLTGITSSVYVLDLTPAATTTYAIVQASNICGPAQIINSPQVISILNRPEVVLSGGDTLCGPGAASLTFQFSQAPGPYNLVWSDGSTSTVMTGIVSNPYTYSPTVSSTRTYLITGFDNATCGGTYSGSAEIVVLTAPSASWQDSLLLCPGTGYQVPLTLTGTPPWTVSYSDGMSLLQISGVLTSPFVFSGTPVSSTTFTLLQVEDSVCQVSANGQIYAEVKPSPAVLLSGPSPVCQGNPALITLTLAGTPPWSIDWTDGSQSLQVSGISSSPWIFSVTPDTLSAYGVTFIQDAFCADTAWIPLSMSVQPLPIASFSFAYLSGDTIQFTNTSQYFSSVLWDFGDQNSSAQLNPVHGYAPSSNSSYIVKLTVSNNCGSDVLDTVITISHSSIADPREESINIKLYPSPTSGDIWLQCTIEEDQAFLADLLDVHGRLLMENKMLNPGENRIDLSDFSSGMYFIGIRKRNSSGYSYRISILKH